MAKDKKRQHVADVLGDVRKQIDKARNPLARMLRKLYLDLQIDEYQFIRNLDIYVNQRLKPHDKNRSTVSGNLSKALMEPKVSWNVFFEGLKMLRMTAFSISLNYHHHDGRVGVITEYFSDNYQEVMKLCDDYGDILKLSTHVCPDVNPLILNTKPPKFNFSFDLSKAA